MPTHALSAAFANEIANPGSVVNVKKQKDKRQKASSDAKGRDHGHFSALDPCNMSVQDMVLGGISTQIALISRIKELNSAEMRFFSKPKT